MADEDNDNDGGTSAAALVERQRRQTEARLAEIEAETRKHPLTSELKPLSCLEGQYAAPNGGGGSTNNFLKGLKSLQRDYESIRTVRGDGNCFYRAFLYQLASRALQSRNETSLSERSETTPSDTNGKNDDDGGGNKNGNAAAATTATTFLDNVKSTWQLVLDAGYDEMTVETFFDSVVELLERCTNSTDFDERQLHELLNEENGASEYCTWYLRCVTAAFLKSDPDRFLPYLEGMDVETFCRTQVEPVGRECEHPQIVALAEALRIPIVVEYLDGHELSNEGKVTRHCFGPQPKSTTTTSGGPTEEEALAFLYRPGHYDILYRRR